MSRSQRSSHAVKARATHLVCPSMKIIDNIHRLLGDDLKETLKKGARLKVAASTFSIFAFDAVKTELANIEGLDFRPRDSLMNGHKGSSSPTGIAGKIMNNK